MQNNDTKGSLGSKFENFGAAPSEGLWGSIADSLDGKKKRKAAIWWWLGAAAVTIAGVGIVLTNMSGQDYTADNNSNVNNSSENVISADSNRSLDDNKMIDSTGRWLSNPTESDQSISSQNRNTSTNQNSDYLGNESSSRNDAGNRQEKDVDRADLVTNGEGRVQLNDETDGATKDKQNAIAQMDELKDDQQEDDAIAADRIPIYEEEEDAAHLLESADRLSQLPLGKLDLNFSSNLLAPITELKQPRHRWELGLMVSRFHSFQGKSQYQWAEPDPMDTTVFAENNLLESIYQNYAVQVIRPIGVKFHAGYQLTRRLRVVSGISTEYSSYSYSKGSEIVGVSNLDGSSLLAIIPAKLTTIGIPIGLEFDFIKHRRFQMGTGVSLLNEFSILETYLPVYDANYAGVQSNNRNFISGYNFGLNFSLNASVHLTERMRLQASPTMRYYQSQKSSSTLNLPKRNFWLGGSVGLIWRLGK